MVHNNVLDTVGNTPLIKLNKIAKDLASPVYAKVECYNPGHSAKDRIALYMIEKAEKEGKITPGYSTIVEATSGNTGFSIAMISAVKGYKCILTVSSKSSKEKIAMLEALGAEVIVCPSGVPSDDPRSYYSRALQMSAEREGAYYLNQNFDLANMEAHYHSTGPEIWKQTEGRVTHFVCSAGTGGTISGTAKYLKEQNPDIQVIGVDADGSVLKTYHETGVFDKSVIKPYKVEGLGKTIIPKNVRFEYIDRFIMVNDRDSAWCARALASQEGLFVGYSSGAAMKAVLELEHELKPTDCVVVLFSDHGSRYVGKVYNDDWMRINGFMDDDEHVSDVEENVYQNAK